MAIDESKLRAVIDMIIPRDADPGALDLGTLEYVRRHLALNTDDAVLVAEGLAALDGQAGGDFAARKAEDRLALLAGVEKEPWFNRVVIIVSEGFYADPDNGGNEGARSWGMIGYHHRLPEGPSGPTELRR